MMLLLPLCFVLLHVMTWCAQESDSDTLNMFHQSTNQWFAGMHDLRTLRYIRYAQRARVCVHKLVLTCTHTVLQS
jgi:hypothetical protein